MKGFKHTGRGPIAGHSFPAHHGFTGSAGKTAVRPHMRGPSKPRGGGNAAAAAQLAQIAQDAQAAAPPAPPMAGAGGPPMGAPDPMQMQAGPPQMAAKGGWIQKATRNKGALHRALGVPQGTKIPAKKLTKAAHSSSPLMRKRANLAKTLGTFHKAGGGVINAEHGANCKCKMCSGGEVMFKARGGQVSFKTMGAKPKAASAINPTRGTKKLGASTPVNSNTPDKRATKGSTKFSDFNRGGKVRSMPTFKHGPMFGGED